MKTYSYGMTPQNVIRQACEDQGEFPFSAMANSLDAQCITLAVNQGIDSHLEAIDCKHHYRKTIVGQRLHVTFQPAGLPVLLRRLAELADDDRHGEELRDNAMSLRSDILDVLGIEEV